MACPSMLQGLINCHQFKLGLINLAGLVAMEDGAIGSLELREIAAAGLPAGRRSKEHAVPILLKQPFSVVVPDRVEHAGAMGGLAVADEALNIAQRVVVVGVDAVPVVHSG